MRKKGGSNLHRHLRRFWIGGLAAAALLASCGLPEALPTGAASSPASLPAPLPASEPEPSAEPVVLAFTGDINLADDWENMRCSYYERNGEISNCLSAELLARMRSADLLLVNHEFCCSDRGAPLPNKQYTFRAKPENAALLHGMGVDLVSLANNHVYDFGKDAFLDTLDVLDGAGIARVGAGRDLAEAQAPWLWEAGGRTFAFAAATRAEKYVLTPEAGEASPGVLRTYDPERFLRVIGDAKTSGDCCIVYVHWGAENSTVLEDAQREQAHAYIDAGADLVIGAHPHCLQGVEYYQGKPIFYSLGNFWFNMETLDTALLEVTVDESGGLHPRLLPCIQSDGRTALADESDQARILASLRALSPGVEFGPDGSVSPAGR